MTTVLHPTARRALVIPARRNSTRLPNKLLLAETGRTVIQHTFETACRVTAADVVVIATDDGEIAAAARRFGALVAMTSRSCPSGTDRVAEVVRRLPAAEIIVNLQGDEPEIDPGHVDRLFASLEDDPSARMATLATPIRTREALDDPSRVKVVFASDGQALYFSRSPIPYAREWCEELLSAEPPHFHQHLGIYAYRRDLLLSLTELPPVVWRSLSDSSNCEFWSTARDFLWKWSRAAHKGLILRPTTRRLCHGGWRADRTEDPQRAVHGATVRQSRQAGRRSAMVCGIVGYVGGQLATDFLLEGLRRLEYRGYDSSGVVTWDEGRMHLVKSAGRVEGWRSWWGRSSWAEARDWGIPVGRRMARRPSQCPPAPGGRGGAGAGPQRRDRELAGAEAASQSKRVSSSARPPTAR